MATEIEFSYSGLDLSAILSARITLIDDLELAISNAIAYNDANNVDPAVNSQLQAQIFKLDNQKRTIVLYLGQIVLADTYVFKMSDKSFQQLALLLDLPDQPFNGS